VSRAVSDRSAWKWSRRADQRTDSYSAIRGKRTRPARSARRRWTCVSRLGSRRGLVCGLVRRASPPCSLASSGGKTAAARPGLWTIHLLLGFGRSRVVGWSRATMRPRAPIRRENRGSSSTDSRADHRVVGELHASPGGQRLLWCRRICRRRRRTPTSCRNGQRS